MSTNTALDQIKNRAEGHTEGPWQLEEGDEAWEVRAPEGSITWDDHGGEVFRNRADAELIAAAPKLLAALEAVEKLANNWQKVGKRPDMFDAALHHAAVKLHTAITEALR